jgi:uncharacterized protein
MKIIMVLVVVLIGIWLFRSNRRADNGAAAHKQRPPHAANSPQDMVRCQLCDLHLPMIDAIQGKHGVYCCPEHLKRVES